MARSQKHEETYTVYQKKMRSSIKTIHLPAKSFYMDIFHLRETYRHEKMRAHVEMNVDSCAIKTRQQLIRLEAPQY